MSKETAESFADYTDGFPTDVQQLLGRCGRRFERPRPKRRRRSATVFRHSGSTVQANSTLTGRANREVPCERAASKAKEKITSLDPRSESRASAVSLATANLSR